MFDRLKERQKAKNLAKFARTAGAMHSDFESMKAEAFLSFAQEEVTMGQVRSLQEWGKQWNDQPAEQLLHRLSEYTEAIRLATTESYVSAVQGAVREGQPLPSNASPVGQLLAERVSYLASLLRKKGETY